MSSVRHPVGPEPEQTYWVRRALVLAGAVLLVALLIALLVGGGSSGNAVSADPSPPPVTVPAAVTPTPSPSESSTPSASPSPSPSASPTPAAKPKAETAEPEREATKPKAEPKAKPKAESKPKPKPAPAACAPADLRATLTGERQLKPKQAATFDLSLINGSDSTCVVEVDAKNFELRLFSGADRIWSSDDCSTAVKTLKKTVKAEEAVAWSVRWDGRRSRAGCQDRPEVPQPGTYIATAQFDGAKPVQLRVILGG